jgi:hypothetical protein
MTPNSLHPVNGHVESLSSRLVTHWAVTEVPLMAAANVQQPRAVNSEHFTCAVQLSQESHVLLIDDTWATGGHVQSAVLALRKAGAARVSVLVVGRWLKEDYGGNKMFIADLANCDYDPRICPWTGAGCPERYSLEVPDSGWSRLC